MAGARFAFAAIRHSYGREICDRIVANNKVGEGEMAGPRFIGSGDKALLVLQRLGEFGPDGRPLSRLASDLGLNKASLHHTLSVLRYRGFVEQDSKGNYRLGQRSFPFAADY